MAAKAQETEFRHPEAAAQLQATVSRGRQNSGPHGFRSKLGKHGKLVDNPCRRFRPGSLGKRCNVASKMRQLKQIPP